ncbi:MAG: nucleoside triphosphate pyrophosphohydrolase [Bradymonadia bacterium]
MSEKPRFSAQDAAKAGEAFARLVRIISRLRDPEGGCPWDQKQTLDSIRRYLLEETYETLDALDSGDVDAHRDELGDLLMQVVFHGQIRHEEGRFDVADVSQAISDKMVRRHPHVFGDTVYETEEELKRAWSKAKTKEGRVSVLDGVPKALPALLRAFQLGNKAASVGFDWPNVEGVVDKIAEEARELTEAKTLGPEAIEHEMGDLLFSMVNLCRHMKIDPETALQKANLRFEGRFRHVEAGLKAENRTPDDAEIDELEARWQAAKTELDDA